MECHGHELLRLPRGPGLLPSRTRIRLPVLHKVQKLLLCAEAWSSITLNSWRNVNSYVVAVRFNTKNWKYPPLPMTVDILNRRFVDNDEKEEILEKEKILTNIINVFRTKSFW